MFRTRKLIAACVIALNSVYPFAIPSAHATNMPIFNPPVPPPQTGNPVYTQETVLSNLTKGITNYATFTVAAGGDLLDSNLNLVLPYTPTEADLLLHGYRFTGDHPGGKPADRPIVVQFSSPVANIVVFPNIDHVGEYWDGYQYQIWGGVLDSSISNQIDFNTLLFDPITVIGTSVTQPCTDNIDHQNFTLGTWAGTGPSRVNNALTLGNEPSLTPPPCEVSGRGHAGYVGYEAYFTFSTAYQFYGFLTSSVSNVNTLVDPPERDFELSAVAEAVPNVAEPSTLLLLGSGLATVAGTVAWRRRRRT